MTVRIVRREGEELSDRFWDVVSDVGTIERVYISSRNIEGIPEIPNVEAFFKFVMDMEIRFIDVSIDGWTFKLSHSSWNGYYTLSITENRPMNFFL